jgi:hypothetical protein
MNTIEVKNKIKNFLNSKTFKNITYTLGILVIAFFIFQAGMLAGFRKVSFGRDWGDNYEKNFGSPHQPFRMGGQNFGDFGNMPNAHGAVGKIIKIELPTIVVFDVKDQTEKVIVVDNKTEIRKMRDIVTKEDLKIDEHVIVIGSPNSSGQIEAKLIRFIPAPPDESINDKTN